MRVGLPVVGVLAVIALLPGAPAASVSEVASVQAQSVVPHNDRAVIFDAYGPGSNGGRASDLIASSRNTLVREHYHVTLYQTASHRQGKRIVYGPGTATLTNFVKSAGAGVIVFSAHGKDFSIAPRGQIPDYQKACNFAKGLFVHHEQSDPLAPRPPVLCRYEPVLLVQNEPDVGSELGAYEAYLRAGYSDAWIEPVAAIAPEGHRDIFGILLTASGIRHFFAHRQVDLVLGSGCYSMSLAPDFNAKSYFGYHSTTWDCEAFKDTAQLFTRLAGHSGVEHRSTVAAYDLGGFADPNFQLDAREPVVLSPAVTAVLPASGTTVGPASTTRGFVTFDAAMDTARTSGVLSASGCEATVVNEHWSEHGRYLGYELRVPAKAPAGTITLTIHHDKAVGAPGHFANGQLDGNQSPSPDNGVEPNASDYKWTVRCGKPEPPPPVPSCQGSSPHLLCFTFDGSGSVMATYPFDGAKDASGTETWHMVWTEPLQTLRTSGGPYPPQAGSTATGHVVVHYDQRTPHPDCTANMNFDPSQTAETLFDSFSYTGQDQHTVLMVATAPMFRLGASGSCPGISAPVDAETEVLHPPVGFDTSAYEQFRFAFSDLPGTYHQTYTMGEHDFTGGGYHGSWTGTMTVSVGK